MSQNKLAQPGDTVRYLNDVGGGTVLRIEGNIAIVDDDGFETPMLLRECVVVGHAEPKKTAPAKTEPAPEPKLQPLAAAATAEPDETVEETPEGERLNVVLAYEPADIKALSRSTYDAYLVNDSNYYLYFAYMTRSEDSGDAGWITRYSGVAEPNMQIPLGEVTADDLTQMDRVAVQYIALKVGKGFSLKAPGAVEYKLDTTKFVKLHCFRESIYFDTPVIAVEIVKDDVPSRPSAIDAKEVERQMNAKKASDRRPKPRPVIKRPKAQRRGDAIEVDLHITELVDNLRGLSPADMLNLQVDEFRRVMDANLKNHGQKIVFIHGKGEGVLRNALMKELSHRYKGHDVQDASFQQYGFGATQVTIR